MVNIGISYLLVVCWFCNTVQVHVEDKYIMLVLDFEKDYYLLDQNVHVHVQVLELY